MPSPLDGPASLRDPFARFLKQKDMVRNIRDPLVHECLRHRQVQFPAQWNISRFWFAYELPPSHPESIHPALLDAMCLLGCLHGGNTLKAYEPLFYTRLQRSLYNCLEDADRLLDFIRASTLLAKYCLTTARCEEGYHRHAATVRFAMACGLHRIDTYNPELLEIPLLRRPKDLVDIGDMIHAWWNVFLIDRLGALLMRSSGTIAHDDERITTLWPCAFEDYENGQATQAPYRGLLSLRISQPDMEPTNRVYDNIYAFRTQGSEVYYYGILLGSSSREGVDVSREASAAIDAALLLSEAMTSYRRQICPTFHRTRNQEGFIHDCALIFAMTVNYGGLIQLLHIFAKDNNPFYWQRVGVARACVELAIEVCQVDLSLLNLTIWLPWYSAYEVLAWEYIRLKSLNDLIGAATLWAELEGLMNAYKTFTRYYSLEENKAFGETFQMLSNYDIHTTGADT
ncbi:hypothetical protein BOTBODRAFT_480231 [Botryobasidium botryosum FD-172 SS1]|uniref:Xylanolytic transcriptional activator regulatory domain-containing protein n=1 Tax=Botryobasidium botryosum (strain FD-172 SS1) TaxID=930990 RepID=A0A067N4A6_BOTB1|nr:hypothetical protein BOTBODRAFT_480231 [Botryobasidium botryosum FD-172 SS1]